MLECLLERQLTSQPAEPLVSELYYSDSDGPSSDYDSSSDEEVLKSPTSAHQMPAEAPPRTTPTPAVAPEGFSFLPSTTVQAPAIPAPDPESVKYAKSCQLLGTPEWDQIRYAEAQKRLHASGVFQPLPVPTSLLAAVKPPSGSYADLLWRMDQTLGTITHALIKQRQAFADGVESILQENPSLLHLMKATFAEEGKSPFHTVSSDLLQFVCGKRAEVFASRRKLYEPEDPLRARFMRAIPPTEVHLFDEAPMADFVRAHLAAAAPRPPPPSFRRLQSTTKSSWPRDRSRPTSSRPATSGHFKPTSGALPARGTSVSVPRALDFSGRPTAHPSSAGRLQPPICYDATDWPSRGASVTDRHSSVAADGCRDRSDAARRHPTSQHQVYRFSLSSLSCPKTGRDRQAPLQPEKAKQLPVSKTVPPGEPLPSAIFSAKRRLPGENRLIASLLPRPGTVLAPSVSLTGIPRGGLRDGLPSLRIGLSSTDLRVPNQLGSRTPQKIGLPHHRISGRFPSGAPGSRRAGCPNRSHTGLSRVFGVESKLHQVHSEPYARRSIFRDFLEPDHRLEAPAPVQDRDNRISGKRSHRVAAVELDTGKAPHGLSKFCRLCRAVRQNSLPDDSAGKSSTASGVPRRAVSNSFIGSHRVAVVANGSASRIEHLSSGESKLHHDRCIGFRLGCSGQQRHRQRPLDSRPA